MWGNGSDSMTFVVTTVFEAAVARPHRAHHGRGVMIVEVLVGRRQRRHLALVWHGLNMMIDREL